MDKILAFMGKSMKEGDTSDAAECLLQYLYENFDEGFKRIAEKNGIVILKDKKTCKRFFNISSNFLDILFLNQNKSAVYALWGKSSLLNQMFMSFLIKRILISGSNGLVKC